MNVDLYEYLLKSLGDKDSVVVKIADFEKLAGDEWLLEASAQAQRLRVQLKPHPGDLSLAVVERDSGTLARHP